MALRLAAIIRRYRRILLAVAGVLGLPLLAITTFVFWPMDAGAYLRAEGSCEVVDREGRPLYAFLNVGEQWCFPVELSEVSPRLVEATVAAEDGRFRRHPGVDPVAVARAVWQNVTRREVVSGASTLTMQVVKLRQGPARSLAGKVGQALMALRLERNATKDEILRAYLNKAPYGQNLVGCEAAARRYFGKPARELTLAEAALLAGIPKSPTACMPLEHPERARQRRGYVLARMAEDDYITDDERNRLAKAPLDARHRDFPTLAPHLAMHLRSRSKIENRTSKIPTTLDAGIQSEAERILSRSVGNVREEIGNAALIAVDVESGEVLARVGSADFFDTPGGGQVDACRAPRSPGSALKPFVFGLAMERGSLYSSEMLLDGTLDFGRFNPENFDEQYRGLVSASEALKASLNVPAVTVLERIGAASAQEFLTGMGLTTLNKPADHYGLGLTLGNCEVRLEELAGAYAMIAALGEYRPLRIVADGERATPRRYLSRGVCLELFEMLEQPLPFELGGAVHAAGIQTRVCWKTGTSTGHRDAWAFVFNRQYLVGVWMGNNDGRPSRRLYGAWSALPLAGRMFRYLPPKNSEAWPEPAGDMAEVTVCAVSGLPASKWCFQTRVEALPRSQYFNRVCDMHYPAPNSGDTPKVVERWPGAAKGWDLARVAPLRPGEHEAREQALRILTPSDEAEFVVTGEQGGDRIKLNSSLNEEAALHWYMDDRFLGTSGPGSPLYLDLEPGKHTLTCMTAAGVLDTVRFDVVLPETAARFE